MPDGKFLHPINIDSDVDLATYEGKYPKTLFNKGVIAENEDDLGFVIKETIDKILANEVVTHKGTNGEKGTGLGLNLTKEFIENNKGTFNICSKPNQGTEITITFNQA